MVFGKWMQSYLGVDKPYYNLIFGRMIPSLLFGFILFFVTDIFNKKIGLLKLMPFMVDHDGNVAVNTEETEDPHHFNSSKYDTELSSNIRHHSPNKIGRNYQGELASSNMSFD